MAEISPPACRDKRVSSQARIAIGRLVSFGVFVDLFRTRR